MKCSSCLHKLIVVNLSHKTCRWNVGPNDSSWSLILELKLSLVTCSHILGFVFCCSKPSSNIAKQISLFLQVLGTVYSKSGKKKKGNIVHKGYIKMNLGGIYLHISMFHEFLGKKCSNGGSLNQI